VLNKYKATSSGEKEEEMVSVCMLYMIPQSSQVIGHS
jgi:hypothetical protein